MGIAAGVDGSRWSVNDLRQCVHRVWVRDGSSDYKRVKDRRDVNYFFYYFFTYFFVLITSFHIPPFGRLLESPKRIATSCIVPNLFDFLVTVIPCSEDIATTKCAKISLPGMELPL